MILMKIIRNKKRSGEKDLKKQLLSLNKKWSKKIVRYV